MASHPAGASSRLGSEPCGRRRADSIPADLAATPRTDYRLSARDRELPVILSGLEEFREHLGGELSVTLLAEIGRSVEVHEMSPNAIAAAIRELRERKHG